MMEATLSQPQLNRQDLVLVAGTLLFSRLLFYLTWDQLALVSTKHTFLVRAEDLSGWLRNTATAIFILLQKLSLHFFGTTEVEVSMDELWSRFRCDDRHSSVTGRDRIDVACLQVTGGQESMNYSLVSQSAECYQCALGAVWNGTVNNSADTHAEIQVDTRYPTLLAVELGWAGLGATNNVSCTTNYHFGQFGLYTLSLDTCEIHVDSRPVRAFLPIFWAFILLCLLAGLRLAYHSFYRTAMFRRLLVWVRLRTRTEPEAVGDSALLLEENPPESRRSRRVVSLDAFRGLSITVMIFVNYGGGSYYFFSHSIWNGLTVADLVFPWFMWIMGVSLVISIQSQLRNSVPRMKLAQRIIRRSIVLVLLGLIMNTDNNHNDLGKLRIPGVLQRFGVSYLIVGLVECWKLPRQYNPVTSPGPWLDLSSSPLQWLLTLTFLLLHGLITFLVPVKDCPTGYLGPGGLHMNGTYYNCTGGAARYIDVAVFGEEHIYQTGTSHKIYGGAAHDPEGLLGCLTSTALVWLGAAAGRILLVHQDWKARCVRWVTWSLLLGLAAGGLCQFSLNQGPIPINKNLWSISFILSTGAMAFFLLTIMYLLIDVQQFWSGSPLFYPGMNSILLYLGHEMCEKMFPWSWRPFTQSHAELLAMNMWGCGLWILASFILYKKRIFLAL